MTLKNKKSAARTVSELPLGKRILAQDKNYFQVEVRQDEAEWLKVEIPTDTGQLPFYAQLKDLHTVLARWDDPKVRLMLVRLEHSGLEASKLAWYRLQAQPKPKEKHQHVSA